MVAGVHNGILAPVVWNSVFAAIAVLGYGSLFISARKGKGPTLRADAQTRFVVITTITALVSTAAAVLSIATGSWIPLAIASIVAGGIGVASVKLF